MYSCSQHLLDVFTFFDQAMGNINKNPTAGTFWLSIHCTHKRHSTSSSYKSGVFPNPVLRKQKPFFLDSLRQLLIGTNVVLKTPRPLAANTAKGCTRLASSNQNIEIFLKICRDRFLIGANAVLKIPLFLCLEVPRKNIKTLQRAKLLYQYRMSCLTVL